MKVKDHDHTRKTGFPAWENPFYAKTVNVSSTKFWVRKTII